MCALKAHAMSKVRPCSVTHTTLSLAGRQVSCLWWWKQSGYRNSHVKSNAGARPLKFMCGMNNASGRFNTYLSCRVLNRLWIYSSHSFSHILIVNQTQFPSSPACPGEVQQWCHSRPIGKTDCWELSFSSLFPATLCWQPELIHGTLCSALLCTVSHFGSKHLLVRGQYFGGDLAALAQFSEF